MKLHTTTWGSPTAKRSIVLIHGVTSSAASWVRVGPALADDGFYVVAPDLRGHGHSPKADGQYALDLMVGDLAESVPRAPALLVGHSYGGVMAILAIRQGILKPEHLLLEDPVLFFADKELPARLLKNDEATLPRDVAGYLRAHPKWQPIDAEGKVASIQAIIWDHMRQVFSDNAPWDLRPDLRNIAKTLPTRLILPEISFYVPPADVETILTDLGSHAVIHVPDAGHSIHRDDLDAFLAVVRQLCM
jgi:pimeloyl-ACP methyl ester carboxylesterase